MLAFRFPRVLLFVLLFSVVGLGIGCEKDDTADASAEKMAKGHDGDTPSATEAARDPTVPVDAREVSYTETTDGTVVTGYQAVPSNADSVLAARGQEPSAASLPGIVVIHEWWGLNDNIRAATRRLAGEGYRALAVDLYGGATAETPENAQSLMNEATRSPEQLMANVRDAHAHLKTEGGASRVAVMGWCFGGGMTFRAVADRPTAFDAAVGYYGTPKALTEEGLDQLRTPILAHFGRNDEVVASDHVEAFRSRLKGREVDVQIYEYDAGHAFANPSGEKYNPQAAQRAWTRTTDFLKTQLTPEAAE